MTEQEAEALAGRLERIWAPESMTWSIVPQPPREDRECVLYVQAIMPHLLDLHVDGYLAALYLCLDDKEGECGLVFKQGQLDPSSFLWEEPPEKALAQREFASQWMTFFRRGCWLSGCDIEATAHEKAEWIWGFTKEEIDAWDLKM